MTGERSAATIHAPAVVGGNAKDGRFFHVRDAAGPFSRGFAEAFYEPFQKETGIRPIPVTGGIEPTGMIKDMVQNGDYAWDIAAISRASNLQLVREGDFLEEIGLATPGIEAIPPAYRSPWFVGNDVYANVIAFRNAAFAGRPTPDSWADFWNVAAFPGRRSLRRHPIDTLEEALLADGVGPRELYPLDVDRAFRSLDRIRPHIARWWTGAAEQTELLTGGDIDLCAISSIRAREAIELGADVGVGWGQNIRTVEGWCILKGSPKAELCREFIRFVATAERQAVFPRHVGSSPTIPAATGLIAPAHQAHLPDLPAHRASAIHSDAEFWSRHKDALIARFEAWFAEGGS